MGQKKRSSDNFYAEYETWKGWQADSDSEDASGGYFLKELQRGWIKPGAKVLELGFGGGGFIDWACSNGYEVSGVEINREMVDKAKSKGHSVYCGTLDDVVEQVGNNFNAVVAFDVFEHLSKGEILANLRLISHILVPTGRILLRFPNGQSPFGRCYQYGDLTHVTVLTGGSVEQAGLMTGFRLVGCYNPIRRQTGRKPKFVRQMAYLVRDILEVSVGHLYYKTRIPLDPNLICILEKDSTFSKEG